MSAKDRANPAAFLIGAVLILLSAASLIFILLPKSQENGFTADIYQNGNLIASISLDEVREPYRFTVTGDGNCSNEIEIRPGSIGIISANCPDKLCVHQGFISDSRLPITCLPTRLLIRLRPESDSSETNASPAAVAY